MKTSTINLSIPRDLLDQADREAKRESRSRSELMRDALRLYLERRARWESIFAYGDAQVKRLGLKQEDVETAIREVRRGR
jgi:CopG family transcriptional regulator/antitoxin EndoAI